MTTAAHPTVVQQLPYEPRSAGIARRLVRDSLRAWQLQQLIDSAEPVMSELVSNAVKTGCQRCMSVSVLRLTEHSVRISVRDGSRVLPCLVTAPAEQAETGRGLALIEALTGGRWGATPEHGGGKTVHADLSTQA